MFDDSPLSSPPWWWLLGPRTKIQQGKVHQVTLEDGAAFECTVLTKRQSGDEYDVSFACSCC